jgi:dihydrodipicolinate synthase/N-acetylneuraminate lyase
MVRTPHYYKKQMLPANILAFYRTVADRSPLPVIIYNFPQATGYDIPAEVVIELAEHPNLIGIKESSGDVEKVRKMVERTRHIKRSASVTETFDAVTPRMLAGAAVSQSAGEMIPVGALSGAANSHATDSHFSQQRELGQPSSKVGNRSLEEGRPSSSAVTVVGKMKTRQKEVGFQVLVGAAHKLQVSLDAGAVGAILAFACPAPTACYEIYAAWKEGDAELARVKQERISKAAQRVGSELGIPGLKYAMDFNGYYGGPARLPFLPLTAALKQEVEQLMADIRN